MKKIKDLKLLELNTLKELNEENMKKELHSAWKRTFVLKMKLSLGELKQHHLIKVLRRYIARIKTIANSKWFNIN